jgi:hypothetical protein
MRPPGLTLDEDAALPSLTVTLARGLVPTQSRGTRVVTEVDQQWRGDREAASVGSGAGPRPPLGSSVGSAWITFLAREVVQLERIERISL